MYVFVVIIVVKQVSCCLASMSVKVNHIVCGQNQEFFFSRCTSDGHASRNMGPQNKEKIAKNYAFVHRNVMVYTKFK